MLRPDGTFTIAARFDASARLLENIRAEVTNSIETRTRRDNVSFDAAFVSSPRVEIDGETVLIIFDGRAGARLWKDWLVAVTRDVDTALDDVSFRGFYDLVAGKPTTP
jgi:hypothetical protein